MAAVCYAANHKKLALKIQAALTSMHALLRREGMLSSCRLSYSRHRTSVEKSRKSPSPEQYFPLQQPPGSSAVESHENKIQPDDTENWHYRQDLHDSDPVIETHAIYRPRHLQTLSR